MTGPTDALAGVEDWPDVVVPGGDGATTSHPVPEPPAPVPPAAAPSRAAAAVTVCRTVECRAEIRMVDTDTGKVMPVDVEPTPGGNMAMIRTPAGWRMHVLKAGEDPTDDPRRWTSHYATCKRPQDYRKPKPTRTGCLGKVEIGAGRLAAVPDAPRVLLVVDGNSLAHRAYHAYEKSGMTGPDERPVWAVYGFLVLLAGIAARVGPDALVVGFDDRAGSARRDRYPDYKAGRAERSPDLYAQLDEIPDVLTELGVTVITPAGLEADDVLASAATVAELAGWRCTIATSDKDAFALITDSVTVMRLTSGLDNAVTMTPAALVDGYGVTPAQWRDYVTLIGDPSDNLPGVLGIGPKTAVKLLAACGTLDAALADPAAALAAVGKAAAGKLATEPAAVAIARNRDLMAAVWTIPVDVDACRPAATGGQVAKVLRQRGLPSLIDRVAAALCRPEPAPPAAGGPDPAPRPRRLRVVDEPRPAGPVTREAMPALDELGAGQDTADRTCSTCSAVCPVALPALEGGTLVLIERAGGLYDQLAVLVDGRWQVRPVADAEQGLPYWNRCRSHWCRPHLAPDWPHRCQTPSHDNPAPPGVLTAGGVFCDACRATRPGSSG